MIKTRLTDLFELSTPIVSAPMAFAAGGNLAAAVSSAGGLGLIGGGYGDPDWVETEFSNAGNQAVGCGFITWKLAENDKALHVALEHKPKAFMLSFGDPKPYAKAIRQAGAKLICQVQDLTTAKQAISAGADVLVAQGGEAGGHGASRSTFTLVPEIVDLCQATAPNTLVLAAGGVADGRGLAASLMLGADGVLVGSRLWASSEATVHQNFLKAAVQATGDQTSKTSIADIARGYDWPAPFQIRTLSTKPMETWDGSTEQAQAYLTAMTSGNAEHAGAVVGEVVGLINDVPSAGELITRMTNEAETLLNSPPTYP
ncbi:MAG: NAD(P)H-dependent flavin oxidoreductase [Alphaproteobacteria bacterium]